MTREFFVARWLKAHPIVYMTSHMVIIPLVDLYATACDWRVAGLTGPPAGLSWFLIVSYLNGIVVEIGRKTRAPADEEHGVETYSALWGRQGAVLRMAARGCCSPPSPRGRRRCASAHGRRPRSMLVVLAAACAVVAPPISFARRKPAAAGGIEMMAGVWTLSCTSASARRRSRSRCGGGAGDLDPSTERRLSTRRWPAARRARSRALERAGLPVPPWFVVSPAAFSDSLTRRRDALETASRSGIVQIVLRRLTDHSADARGDRSGCPELCPDGELGRGAIVGQRRGRHSSTRSPDSSRAF